MVKFNVTHLEHTLIAIGVQLVIFMALMPIVSIGFGKVAVGVLLAMPGIMLFFGREHAQAESKIQDKLHTSELPWSITLEAMKFWTWDEDSMLDFLCPAIACILISIVLCFLC